MVPYGLLVFPVMSLGSCSSMSTSHGQYYLQFSLSWLPPPSRAMLQVHCLTHPDDNSFAGDASTMFLGAGRFGVKWRLKLCF